MIRAVLRDLRTHRGRVSMMLAAIAVGVAFVVATWVVSDTIAHTLGGGPGRGDVAVSVRALDPDAALTAADRERLAALPGVTAATGVVVGRASLIGRDGKLAPAGHDRAGTGWDGSTRFSLVDGRAPAGPGEMALGELEASEAGFAVGDRARVILADGSSDTAVVVGLFIYRTLGTEPKPSIVYDATTAARLLDDRFERIDVTAGPGVDAAALANEVRRVAGSDVRIVATGAELAEQARAAVESDARAYRESLLAAAAVALVAAVFVIANTFTMLVTRRTRAFALLRMIGASRGQVRRTVLTEAAALGFVGSTLGVLTGVGLGLLALVLLRPAGMSVAYTVSPIGVAAGYLAGVLTTMMAAYGSARRAAAVAPVSALRTDAVAPRRVRRVRAVIGLAIVAVGVAAVAGTAGTQLDDTDRFVGMGGAVVVWLGLLVLAPLLAAAALRPVARLADLFGGPATKLAVRNAIRDPRRTAATASALTIGLALLCGFATMGSTLTGYAGESVRDLIPPSTTVVRSAAQGLTLGNDVVDRVGATAGVDTVLAVPRADVPWEFGTTRVSAVDPAAFTAALRPRITAGTADLRRGAVVLRTEADTYGLRPGDVLRFGFDPDDPVEVVVAGVYDAIEGSPGVFVDAARVPAELRGTLEAVYATGDDPDAVRAALDAAFADRPDVQVTDADELADGLVAELELALAVIYALFAAALLIAVLGVVNTLVLAVTERTREIGVLRALGASRRLIRRTVRVESLVITSYGGLLGVGIGLLLGAVMQHVMLSRELWRIVVPYPVVGAALVGLVLAGVLAAAWPARRAARTDILTAITPE